MSDCVPSPSSDSSYASSSASKSSSGSSASPTCEISLLERLIRTHPIWFLPSLQRSGALHLLQVCMFAVWDCVECWNSIWICATFHEIIILHLHHLPRHKYMMCTCLTKEIADRKGKYVYEICLMFNWIILSNDIAVFHILILYAKVSFDLDLVPFWSMNIYRDLWLLHFKIFCVAFQSKI